MKLKTKLKIIAVAVICVLIIYYFHYMYTNYGEIGMYVAFIVFFIIAGMIAYIGYSIQHPNRRRYYYDREPAYREEHFYDERDRRPVRRPYQQDERISPMYHNKAKNFSSHKWDVVDDSGYFGKKKRRR